MTKNIISPIILSVSLITFFTVFFTSSAFAKSNKSHHDSSSNKSSYKKYKEKRDYTLSRIRGIGKIVFKSTGIEGVDISYTLVRDGKINAKIMPWGEIRIHSGILDFVKNDAHMALLLAHEMAHFKLDHFSKYRSIKAHTFSHSHRGHPHGNRRMSSLLDLELEADKLGIVYMAKAGYNPSEALSFMKSLHYKTYSPINSSHPTFLMRYKNMKTVYSKALKFYDIKVGKI